MSCHGTTTYGDRASRASLCKKATKSSFVFCVTFRHCRGCPFGMSEGLTCLARRYGSNESVGTVVMVFTTTMRGICEYQVQRRTTDDVRVFHRTPPSGDASCRLAPGRNPLADRLRTQGHPQPCMGSSTSRTEPQDCTLTRPFGPPHSCICL